jgi:hypothetical protein
VTNKGLFQTVRERNHPFMKEWVDVFISHHLAAFEVSRRFFRTTPE